MLGDLGATLSFLLTNRASSLMFQRLCTLLLVLLTSDMHRLIQFIVDHFPCGRFHVVESDCRLFGSSLRLQLLTLGRQVVLCASRESLAHISITLVFLVNQMVRGRNMIMSVRLQASDRVLFLKLEVVY